MSDGSAVAGRVMQSDIHPKAFLRDLISSHDDFGRIRPLCSLVHSCKLSYTHCTLLTLLPLLLWFLVCLSICLLVVCPSVCSSVCLSLLLPIHLQC